MDFNFTRLNLGQQEIIRKYIEKISFSDLELRNPVKFRAISCIEN